ncbi:MAG: hypothetical protein ACTH32_05595 [Microbacterium gubbeenense]
MAVTKYDVRDELMRSVHAHARTRSSTGAHHYAAIGGASKKILRDYLD